VTLTVRRDLVEMVISSRRGFIPAGPPVWLPQARREETTAVPRLPLISESVPGPGSARVLVVVLVVGRADDRLVG
jgi:hypothetical protein